MINKNKVFTVLKFSIIISGIIENFRFSYSKNKLTTKLLLPRIYINQIS